MADQGSKASQGDQPETSASSEPEAERSGPPAGAGELGEALSGLLKVFFRRGREELERAASTGRVRLELRQLRRDRDVMYQKLGREVRALLEGGELDHPGLARGVERIEEMDAHIVEVERRATVRTTAGEGEGRSETGT